MTPERLWKRTGTAAAALTALLTGCAPQENPASAPPPRPAVVRPAPNRGTAAPQEAFLARIRRASATNGVIEKAAMNGDDELGVVVGRQVKMKAIRPLMTGLLREMRDAFPNRPLRVIAYAPNNKPLATMEYNPSAPANANVTYKPNF